MANGQDMKETLDRIEEDIARVKRLYDLYFQGSRRTEPSDKRREVEETLRRMGQRKIVNTNEQFRFNSLQTRFYSLSNLWARMVRDLEEGRLTRDTTGPPMRVTAKAPDPVDPARLDRVIGELVEARKACGLPAGEEDLSATREALLARAREIAEKSGGRHVEFQIRIEEGKPKVKAVVR
jgi:hypothetical protein